MNRFFRAAAAVYSQVRAGLDSAFGHPKAATSADGTEVVTLSCLPPVESARPAGGGQVLVPVSAHDCQMPEVEPVLSGLLQSGVITEITEAQYWEAVNS